MTDFAEKIADGKKEKDLTKDMQYYDYYKEAYTVALSGMVGSYEEEREADNGNKITEQNYGIRWFRRLPKLFLIRATMISERREATAIHARISDTI